MKKLTAIILSAVLMLTLCSCSLLGDRYTVTFSDNGVIAQNMPAAQKVKPGEKVKLPDKEPDAEDYLFGGWFREPECTDDTRWDFDNWTVNSDIVLYAKWTSTVVKTHKVSFSANGKDAENLPGAVDVPAGTAVQNPGEIDADGFYFGGWYKDSAGKNKWNFDDPVNSNFTLYARWIKIESSLTAANLVSRDYVKWQGRTEYKAASQATFFYYTAAGFEVNFYGTSVSAVLTTNNTSNANSYTQISVSIDDEVFPEGKVIQLSKASEEFVLAENLAPGNHTVKIAKRSEPTDSENSVTRISTDGQFLLPPEDASAKFLIVGGSGISGHGALGKPGNGRTTKNSSSLHSFGYLTARMYGGDYQFVSASGWGLKYGYNSTNGVTNLRTAMDSVGISSSGKILATQYDHSLYTPDYVIFNCGGNDYSAYISTLTGAAQTAATQAFVYSVRDTSTYLKELFPNVKIIWTYNSGTANGNGINQGLSILPAALKNDVVSCIIYQVASDGDPAGANNHASVYTHIKSSNNVAQKIKEISGNSPIRSNITWPQ